MKIIITLGKNKETGTYPCMASMQQYICEEFIKDYFRSFVKDTDLVMEITDKSPRMFRKEDKGFLDFCCFACPLDDTIYPHQDAVYVARHIIGPFSPAFDSFGSDIKKFVKSDGMLSRIWIRITKP